MSPLVPPSPASLSSTPPYRLLELDALGSGTLGPDMLGPGAGQAPGPLADEALLRHAIDGPVACLWHAAQGLVVPRTYAARSGFAQAQADFARRGWPIHVRQSGGGVVPQGPGILNLSLAQRFAGRPLDHSETCYRQLCGLIAAALLHWGIDTRAQAVEGSFCDGRYNLASGQPARKVVGTAQVWRHIPGQPPDQQIGLVHALILVRCSPQETTAQANALEAALGSPRRYDAGKIASLDQLIAATRRADFERGFAQTLKDTIAHSRAIAA
ncbi:hypothetical protein CCAE64S_02492 [Castellaniella caeni]